ncbi:MAG: GNAT family N-acetyltransferase [Caldilineaceae bacterium]|nr:GNAT family N-acetyltransferase [Caldilineaceae bacterium]
MADLVIEEWGPTHPRWDELLTVVAELQQTRWLTDRYDWHRSSHFLVAIRGNAITGFLRFVTQTIGPDAECGPVSLDGVALLEAKILAFGVLPVYRRQGIGRALQEACVRRAAQLNCYQVRSHSSGDNIANHQLKLAMGFGVHPIIRGDDRRGVYFVLPLREGVWDTPTSNRTTKP